MGEWVNGATFFYLAFESYGIYSYIELLMSYAFSIKSEQNGALRLSISGSMSIENLNSMIGDFKKLFHEQSPSELIVDLASVEYMDSGGALFLFEMENEAIKKSIPFNCINISQKEKSIIQLLDKNILTQPPLVPKVKDLSLIEQIGKASLVIYEDLIDVISFHGELVVDMVYSLLHPFSVRWRYVLLYMKKVGVDGLPILGLISFLLGLIIAFMSSLQLKQFGANIYVASLVSIAMVRELGPIITAILVAGRSGSAFAAEIGTMKVNEEVDALITMGFNPMRFLAIPKVFAAMLVMPILTLFANLFAIGGGMVVGILGLNLTLYTYVQETMNALALFDITTSFIKSVVFALLIAAIGCQRGFKVRGGAEAVGNATTSAVVYALFLIIVSDSLFAIILHYID